MAVTFPKRFDEQEAKKGVWFDVYDEHDQFYGSYLCRMYDDFGATSKMLKERYFRVEVKETSGKDWSIPKKDAHFLAHVALLDWKLKDDNGKDVPYSKEAVVEILGQDEAHFVTKYLFRQAANTSHYRPADHPAETQDEVAKN